MFFTAQRALYYPAHVAGKCLQGASTPAVGLWQSSPRHRMQVDFFIYDTFFVVNQQLAGAGVCCPWQASSVTLLGWNEQHSTGMGYRALGGQGKDGRWGEDFCLFTLMGLVSVHFSSCSCSTPEASSPYIRSPPYPTTSPEETVPKNALLSFMKAVTPSTSLLSLQCAFLTSW